jgi:hypothetical protein
MAIKTEKQRIAKIVAREVRSCLAAERKKRKFTAKEKEAAWIAKQVKTFFCWPKGI